MRKIATIHTDATGGVTKQMGDKRPLFYVVLADQQDGKSYPIGHMLSESHCAPSISHFLSQLTRDYKVVTGKFFKPK